jgi:NADH:ubiquinone oxidoreductase subunit C
MTQEINYNLRLIDMMEWSGVQDDFKLELCKNFRTEEMEYYLKIISLDFLNEIMSQIPNSSDDNGIKEIPFCAAINKMESLKVLANLNQNLLEENNRAKIEVRIKNIKEDLSSIKSITK